MNFAAVITAAGSSERMGGGIKKEYRLLPGEPENGRTVLSGAVEAFLSCDEIKHIVIVHSLSGVEGEAEARAAIGTKPLEAHSGRVLFVPGGRSRRESVFHGLTLLHAYSPAYVLIHDGARPWVTPALIRSVISAVLACSAAIPVVPLVETPKITENGFVARHLPRGTTAAAQTPQGFAFDAVYAAHRSAAEEFVRSGREFTDDAEIYDAFSPGKIAAVPGDASNRKITFPEDLGMHLCAH